MKDIIKFKCSKCGNIKETDIGDNLFHPYMFFNKVYKKCPVCDKRHWHIKIVEEIKGE